MLLKIIITVVPIFLLSLISSSCNRDQESNYMDLIEKGEFTKAEKMIKKILETDHSLEPEQKKELLFEIERMNRIKKDFTKTEDDVMEYIKEYIPEVTEAHLNKWEKQGLLEYMRIDGEKYYFNQAAANMFRKNKDLRAKWIEYHRGVKASKQFDLENHISEVIKEHRESGNKYIKPIRIRWHYSISLLPDMVPEGEIIRCWIPFPREIPGRQTEISLLDTDPDEHLIAPNDFLQRTIYLEKPSLGKEITTFSIQYEYTNHAVYVDIDANHVLPVDLQGDLKPFLQEEYPHIVFSDELKELSRKIVGDESNPYRKAQLLFEWIDLNIPWTSAREYSTIRNISSYCYENRQGDCGQKALLQITLCRLNGIPARWQSGWRFKPPEDLMHDWAMVYFEPYGWLPMDVDYGIMKSDNDDIKWFYLGGMDSYRLIFNDAYSKDLYPDKEYFRSETVDSQRGELEWKGGNLFFDQWHWNVDWEIIDY
jgi:hypothetical protein